MKTIGVVGVLALGLTGGGAAAQGGASVRVTERESAAGLASVQTPVECGDGSTGSLATSIVVGSSVESVGGGGGASEVRSLAIDWFEFDPCTGQLRHTVRIIDAPESEHDGLRSASVAGTFELVDVTVPVGTVVIDVQWSGTGAVTRTNAHGSSEVDGSTVVTLSREGRRLGELSGSVTLNGVQLALSGPGELVSTRTLEITLPP